MDYFEVQQKVTKENRDKINKLRSRLDRQPSRVSQNGNCR